MFPPTTTFLNFLALVGVKVGVSVATEVRGLKGGVLGAEELHGGGLAITVAAFTAKV